MLVMDQRSSELSNRHADEINQIEKQAREQRTQAQARRDKALLRISDQKTTAEKELQARHKQIDDQREQQLSDAGVDTKKLRKLSEDAEATEKKIRTTEERSTTVSRWRTWIAEGGHARLPDLIARQAAADQEAQKAEDDLQAHRKSMDDSASD
jgi:hypothetical protein